MRSFVCAVLCAVCLAGCDAGGSCEPRAAGATPAASAKPASPDPVGLWTFDGDGFVETNQELLLRIAAPGITMVRQGHARIAALPAHQRDEAMRRMRETLSPQDLEVHDAALGGDEGVKAWAKKALRERMGTSRFDVDLRSDGTCSLALDLSGERTEARGTWTRAAEGAVIRIATVDGKPAPAKDRQPKTLSLRDDRLYLEYGPGSPTLVARRKG